MVTDHYLGLLLVYTKAAETPVGRNSGGSIVPCIAAISTLSVCWFCIMIGAAVSARRDNTCSWMCLLQFTQATAAIQFNEHFHDKVGLKNKVICYGSYTLKKFNFQNFSLARNFQNRHNP